MTINEWEIVFFKMMAAFPNWKPDARVSLVWFECLGQYAAQDILQSFQNLCVKSSSDFPPNLFQLLAEIKKSKSGIEQVDEAWNLIIQKAAGRDYKNTPLSPAAERAARAIGGIQKIGLIDESELKFLKRDFVRAFEDFAESEIANSNPLLSTGELKKIGTS